MIRAVKTQDTINLKLKKKYGDKPRRDNLWKPKPKGDFKTEKDQVKKGINLKTIL